VDEASLEQFTAPRTFSEGALPFGGSARTRFLLFAA
jgi:hypothetical protein